MEKQLIISLISDQTIPNVQIIKEFGTLDTDYLYILTEGMKKKGAGEWIKKACDINLLDPIIVNEYSLSDVQVKLSGFDYSKYDKIYVNITGGTKIMTLGVYDFYKSKQADIYYITRPEENKFIHIGQDGQDKIQFSPKSKITLREYLTAYGFDVKETEQSGVEYEQTTQIFQSYCKGVFNEHIDALKFLREKRKKDILFNNSDMLDNFLKAIKYTPKENNKLSNIEVKYLTGEWFEEYIGNEIKTAFSLSDDEILIGATIRKDIAEGKEINPIANLLAIDIEKDSPNNEIDVMFIKNNKFHIIECKTSIIDSREVQEQKKTKKGKPVLDSNGEPEMETKTKKINILGETLYKSDAIKTKFGLFARSYIFTLTDFKEYIKGSIENQQRMVDLINRASISKIKLVDKSMLQNLKWEEIIR